MSPRSAAAAVLQQSSSAACQREEAVLFKKMPSALDLMGPAAHFWASFDGSRHVPRSLIPPQHQPQPQPLEKRRLQPILMVTGRARGRDVRGADE